MLHKYLSRLNPAGLLASAMASENMPSPSPPDGYAPYQELAESISDVFFATDRDFRCTYWNRAAATHTGIAPEQALGHTIAQLFPNFQDTEAEKCYQESLLHHQPRNCTFETGPDAADVVFELHVYPAHHGLSVFMQDITARVQAERILRESESRYRLLMEGASDAIFIADAETGRLVDANRKAQELIGRSLEEIREMHQHELHPVEDRQQVLAYFQQGGHNPSDQLPEVWVVHKTGQRLPVEINASSIEVGGRKLLQGIFRDVSAQKKATVALRRSEELFRHLFERAPIGMAITTTTGEFLRVNEAFCHVTGYLAGELLGLRFRDITHPEDLEANTELDNQLLEGTLADFQLEKRYIRKDGRVVHVLLQATLLRDSAGEPECFLGQIVDITHRKQTEDSLRQITQELLRSNAELEKFAFITSHNLRAPLVNMLSLLGLFNKQGMGDAQNQLIFEKFELAVQRLNETLDDLVDIVGIRKKAHEPRQEVWLESICTEVLKDIEGQIMVTGASVQVDFSAAPTVFYPHGHIQNILLNLLTNAIKYRAPQRTPEIRIFTFRQSNFTVLNVSDNGQGIDLERYGEKIFGLYQRFHEGSPGKGMGLYIVKSQVEALGGYVEVESRVGEGTTFRIYLNDHAD